MSTISELPVWQWERMKEDWILEDDQTDSVGNKKINRYEESRGLLHISESFTVLKNNYH